MFSGIRTDRYIILWIRLKSSASSPAPLFGSRLRDGGNERVAASLFLHLGHRREIEKKKMTIWTHLLAGDSKATVEGDKEKNSSVP